MTSALRSASTTSDKVHGDGGTLVALPARCLRQWGAGSGCSPRARLFVAVVAAGLLGLGGGGKALAGGGPGPEPAPPVGTHGAPSPEVAPVSGKAVSTTSTRSRQTSQGLRPSSTSAGRVAAPKTWTAPARPQASSTPVSRPPSQPPRARKAHKAAAQPTARVRHLPRREAIGALPPVGSRGSNLLLFGGLALLVLVLGDAMLLTLSARFLREAGE